MSKKKNRNYKQLVALFLAIMLFCTTDLSVSAGTVTVVGGISKVGKNTSNTTSKYSTYWQYWSQGASQYSGMRSGGCRVTAFAKLIKEAGYANFSNPDDFFIWGINSGYFKSTSSAYEMTSFGEAIKRYISDQGGSCSLVTTITLSNTATDKANIMSYIKQGYYVVLSSSEHTAYIGRAASIQQGTPVILDSWSSWSTNPATSHTYTGSYDSMSGCSFTKYRVYSISQKNVDTTPPTVSDFKVIDIDNSGYTLSLIATDNSGSIPKVQFPTWTDANGQDDLVPNWENNSSISGSWDGNRVYYRVNTSDHNNEEGRYRTHVYVYDSSGNYTKGEASVYIDRTKPVITNVRITDVSSEGYTVLCDVTDDMYLARVQFPTWTRLNDQDDIVQEWWTNPEAAGINTGGSTFSYRVNRWSHNGEVENYYTHIYAYDGYGNYAVECIEVPCLLGEKKDLGNEFVASIKNIYAGTVLTNDNTNVSGRKYQGNLNQKWLFKRQSNGTYEIVSMSDDGKCLTVQGGADRNGTNVNVSTKNNSGTQRWKIYGSNENQYFFMPEFSAGQALDLNGASGNEGTNVQIYECWGGTPQVYAINMLSTSITLNATQLQLQKGASQTITATVLPNVANDKTVLWSSSDDSVASVTDGKITAKRVGTAVITATTQDSALGNAKVSACCTVTVYDNTPVPPAEDDEGNEMPSIDDDEVNAGNIEDNAPESSWNEEESDTEEEESSSETEKSLSKGDFFTVNKVTYKVTSSANQKPTVEYSHSSKGTKKIKVPDTVTHLGVKYTVKSIGKNAFKSEKQVTNITIGQNITSIKTNAFKDCQNLKSIVINSKKITSVGKNALKNTNQKLTIKTPKNKVEQYKKLFKNKGNSRVKIKKQ